MQILERLSSAIKLLREAKIKHAGKEVPVILRGDDDPKTDVVIMVELVSSMPQNHYGGQRDRPLLQISVYSGRKQQAAALMIMSKTCDILTKEGFRKEGSRSIYDGNDYGVSTDFY